MKIKYILNGLFLVFLIVATIIIISRSGEHRLIINNGTIFGTQYHIEYEYKEDLDTLILAELKKVDTSLSMFNDSSTVSRLNRGEAIMPDSMFQKIFMLAQYVSADTNGAFDVTVAPLVDLWGFGTAGPQEVSPQAVDSIMTFIGYEKVRLKKGHLHKDDSRVKLDFSSIAKGYGVDCVARLFDSISIGNYMVEIGGEVVVKGKHPKGRPWKIGINKPTSDNQEGEKIQTVLSLTDVAMATSGNYRRFYERNGKRYAHTIDPQSGYPVQHGLLSATVLAPDCATADAYATAFMVMGTEKAKQILARHPELAAYLIYDDGEGHSIIWNSPNFPSSSTR